MISSDLSIFLAVIVTNLLNFIDRGIIPGASIEFNQFIQQHVDTSSPDVYLGFLVRYSGNTAILNYIK